LTNLIIYLPQRVLIEVSSRSLMEPSENREINSILSAAFPAQAFARGAFAKVAEKPGPIHK
jgi:hypothetical protein